MSGGVRFMQEFDLIVIGGGPGGYVAAIRASQMGLKTALVEREHVGGTCLNRGCIPTKALLHASEILWSINNCSDIGIEVENIKVDIKKVYEKKDKIVKKLRSGIEYLLKNNNITVFKGEGCFIDKNTIKVSGAENSILSGKNVIIATGSVPSVPPIPGADSGSVQTSDNILSLDGELPKSIAIIGGGVIGIEIATIFSDFGSQITIIEMMEHILPGIDVEVSGILRKNLEKKGIKIYTDSKVKSIEGNPKKVCSFEQSGQSHSIESDAVLVSAGRRPYTQGLNIEALGIKQTRGFIQVDKNMETSIPGVYAIGDVIGGIQLAHVASSEGICAVESIAGKESKINKNLVPSCIYSRPEISCIGMTEQEALSKGYRIRIGKFPMSANGKSMIMGETEGMVKLITEEKTGEVIGAHIIGARATDMIGEIAALMNAEGTIEELSQTIHPHPTVCETIMEAAHDVDGLCVHIPRKSR